MSDLSQVTEIKDVTQLDLKEIEQTGAPAAGEKTLADLRKRKLIVQKCVSKMGSKQCDLNICAGRDNGSL